MEVGWFREQRAAFMCGLLRVFAALCPATFRRPWNRTLCISVHKFQQYSVSDLVMILVSRGDF